METDTDSLFSQLAAALSGSPAPIQTQPQPLPPVQEEETPSTSSVGSLNLLEQWRQIAFSSQSQECKTAADLLQKVVALRCLHEGTLISHLLSELAKLAAPISTPTMGGLIPDALVPMHLPPVLTPATTLQLHNHRALADFDFHTAYHMLAPVVQEVIGIAQAQNPRKVMYLPECGLNELPVYFESLTIVLEKLCIFSVDPIVSWDIAIERVCLPIANPFTIMAHASFENDEKNVSFFKNVVTRLHNHKNFSQDGAPYTFDIKTYLRLNEHLHRKIRDLRTVSPAYPAHEISLTISAMARFMAMHESSFDLQIMFPCTRSELFERAYHSAVFWTYREAFRTFYYQSMTSPLPAKFEITVREHRMLNRYWDAGNRHVTVSESALIAKKCSGLAPFQVYGFFEKRRRNIYRHYGPTTDREIIIFNTLEMFKSFVSEMKDDDAAPFHCLPSCSTPSLPIQREQLSREEKALLETLWNLGYRDPSLNECLLLVADHEIERDEEQIHAWFEDRRWREAYLEKKRKREAAEREKAVAEAAKKAAKLRPVKVEPPKPPQKPLPIPVYPKRKRRRVSVLDAL